MRPDRQIEPYDRNQILCWDWSGINLRKESQGLEKAADSVQRKVIDYLLQSDEPWDLIFDDDDAREAADVVAIRMTGDRLIVHLFHCKFSHEAQPGHRIADMYEVCGQAQKSVYWRDKIGIDRLIPHLVERERRRTNAGKSTRIEKGDYRIINEIGQRYSVLIPEFKVFVVQPGLSKHEATREMLELLAATSLYLNETFEIGFGVIASD